MRPLSSGLNSVMEEKRVTFEVTQVFPPYNAFISNQLAQGFVDIWGRLSCLLVGKWEIGACTCGRAGGNTEGRVHGPFLDGT